MGARDFIVYKRTARADNRDPRELGAPWGYELTDLDVSTVDKGANPGAKILITKRDDSREGGGNMADLATTIRKALIDEVDDSEKERSRKACVRKALADGLVTPERVGAELALESLAKSRIATDRTRSFEQHYVDVLRDPANRDLVRLLE